ncbi:uncharacterized protein [Triticum aestivum]|uniref:uncharacterized protein n=1 Tax=Triticum aestivum TaxID=4565 RepID=UPI001D02ED07|nr:uncharacterized protein LOC123114912 [Triticum aestivum]
MNSTFKKKPIKNVSTPKQSKQTIGAKRSHKVQKSRASRLEKNSKRKFEASRATDAVYAEGPDKSPTIQIDSRNTKTTTAAATGGQTIVPQDGENEKPKQSIYTNVPQDVRVESKQTIGAKSSHKVQKSRTSKLEKNSKRKFEASRATDAVYEEGPDGESPTIQIDSTNTKATTVAAMGEQTIVPQDGENEKPKQSIYTNVPQDVRVESKQTIGAKSSHKVQKSRTSKLEKNSKRKFEASRATDAVYEEGPDGESPTIQIDSTNTKATTVAAMGEQTIVPQDGENEKQKQFMYTNVPQDVPIEVDVS